MKGVSSVPSSGEMNTGDKTQWSPQEEDEDNICEKEQKEEGDNMGTFPKISDLEPEFPMCTQTSATSESVARGNDSQSTRQRSDDLHVTLTLTLTLTITINLK